MNIDKRELQMDKKQLLIIEDEASVAKQLKWGLGSEYEVTVAANGDEARRYLASGRFSVATLDLGLPPYADTAQEGLALLEALPRIASATRIIVITGNDDDATAMQAVGLGAIDFCSKPVDLKLLKVILSRTFLIAGLEEANRCLQEKTSSFLFSSMLGVSPAMLKLFELIKLAAISEYPVLVSGESGTGKEMVAGAVHQHSQRSEKPLVIINCGAIPENLLESELFGHEKGAFTGADARQIGKFEQADGGTVFLDEIGEMPLPLQVKLLRCLQQGTIERLGGGKTIQLDLRIIAATNVDLEEAVRQGTFRQDLFFRLNVVPLALPPLRERGEDILLLAHHFIRQEAQVMQRGTVSLAPAAVSALDHHSWPGNVRELQNRVRRALSLSSGSVLTAVDLGLEDEDEGDERLLTLKQARAKAEKNVIRQALLLTDNNISQAAKLLETSRPTLHDLIKKHGIG